MEKFNLREDDHYAIDVSCNVIRKFLKNPGIKPKMVIGLGNALYALERMPNVTAGAFCEFGIIYRSGTENFEEMKYITIRISDESFSISRGGSVYDSSIGSDSFSEPDWTIEIGGYRDTRMDILDLVESIEEYLNLGAEITVEDESDIDFGRDE